jgi:hypothetical protein
MLLATLLCVFSSADVAAQGFSAQAVRAAWEKREASVTSFAYECDLRETVFGTEPLGVGEAPRASKALGDIAVVRAKLRYNIAMSVSANKIAYRQQGDDWEAVSGRSYRGTFRAAFDGAQSRELRDFDGSIQGFINERPEPIRLLSGVEAHSFPLWFAYAPHQFLSRLGCDINQLTVDQTHCNYRGQDCVVLVTPRPNSPWVGFVYVDPAKDLLPVGFRDEHQGVRQNEVSVEYRRDEMVGWAISGWTNTFCDPQGRPTRTMICEVTRCAYNKLVDESVFKINFPTGAKVVVEDAVEGRKYFLQLENGQTKPITEDDF